MGIVYDHTNHLGSTVRAAIAGWEMVKRLEEVLPTSRQDWEVAVVKPVFARNPTVIYQRATSP